MRQFRTWSAIVLTVALSLQWAGGGIDAVARAPVGVPAVPAGAVPLSAPAQALPGGATAAAPAVVLVQGEGTRALRIAPPPGAGALDGATVPQGAVFYVDWLEGQVNAWGYACAAWPAGARSAFEHALALWGAQLVSAVPIHVDACWAALGTGVLGVAGPAGMSRGFPGAPHAGTWYPAALVNALLGYDWNDADGWDADRDGSDQDPEINVCLNRTFSRWYEGLDGSVPWNEYDLVTAAMHEIAHGLGFVGSMEVTAGQGQWGLGTSYPLAYDRLLQDGAGRALLDQGHYPNPSTALAEALLGQRGGVYLDGVHVRAMGGGQRAAAYAPPAWEPGASISHLDDRYSGGVDALMTRSLYNGQAVHDPGPTARGVLWDIGWPACQPDLSVSTRVQNGADIEAGDAVTVVLALRNAGLGLATEVVLTATLSAGLDQLSWVSSPSLSAALPAPAGDDGWVWHLPDLAPGAGGAITITGVVEDAGSERPAIWVLATISSAECDRSFGDNSSRVLLGGYRAFMPAIVRGSS